MQIRAVFSGVVLLDLMMLGLPTKCLGWRSEVLLAAILAVVTGLLWCSIQAGKNGD